MGDVVGQGSTTELLTDEAAGGLLADGLEGLARDGRSVLVIIPDGTRHAPIPLLFRLLYEQLGPRVSRLDYLIALGTHPPMSEAAVDRLVGVPAAERARHYPRSEIFGHSWDQPDTLTRLGSISRSEVSNLTGGALDEEIPVVLNRRILDYDQLLICGPVFPHEVAGFSGGAKYLFPGIAGPDIINATHWVGALATSMHTIGVKETPVRRLIHRAAELVPRPVRCIALVVKGQSFHGMYVGHYADAWSRAADLSRSARDRPRPEVVQAGAFDAVQALRRPVDRGQGHVQDGAGGR